MIDPQLSSPLVIGLVGPCTSGKSSLKQRLEKEGFRVHHIAQEHSFVPDMWKRVVNPDVLIFLQVSYEETLERRATQWTEMEFQEQLRRLENAYDRADLILETTGLSEDDVLQHTLAYLNSL